MNREENSGFAQVFILSFIIVALKLIYMSVNPFLPIILNYITIKDYTFYRNILDIFGIMLSGGIIAAGYWFGKKADMVNHYKDYIRGMVYSWILIELIVGVGWFLTEDFAKSVFEVAFVTGLGGYSFLVPFFSGIALGWLVEEKFTVRPVWSNDILRYVLIFQGAVLVQSLIRVYLSKTMLYSGSPPAAYGLSIEVLSFTLIPFSLWFLWKMFETGKRVELRVEYGSILFTLWAPQLIVSIIGLVANMVVIGQMSGVDWLFNMGKDLVGVTIGVFGNAFALLCFGCIHSRYMHVEMLNKIEKETIESEI